MRVLPRGERRAPGLCVHAFPAPCDSPRARPTFLPRTQPPSRPCPTARVPRRRPAQPHLEAQHVRPFPEQRQFLPGEGGAGAGRMQGPPGQVWQHGVIAPFPKGRHRSRHLHRHMNQVSSCPTHTITNNGTCAAGCEGQTSSDCEGTAGGGHRADGHPPGEEVSAPRFYS